MGSRKRHECAYCGRSGANTRDHIPAQAIFKGLRDVSKPTVRACEACNTGASDDDEYFRNIILLWRGVGDRPAAQPALEALFRSIALPAKQRLAAAMYNSMFDADVLSAAGLVLGQQPAIKVDDARFRRAATRYVRGLYRVTFGQRVLGDADVSVTVEPEVVLRHIEKWGWWFENRLHVVAEDVFAFAWSAPVDRPDVKVCLMVFFDAFPILGVVRPAGELPPTVAVEAVPSAGDLDSAATDVPRVQDAPR